MDVNLDFITEEDILTDYRGTDKKVVIPEGIEGIDDGVFYKRADIESVVIPEGVVSIGNSAFFKCTSLTEINIPESVKAVLHITYHSCTAKTNGNENALDFLELCKTKNIPFYMTAVKDSSIYETSNTLLQNGALPIYNMSNEMSFSSLLIKYNVG